MSNESMPQGSQENPQEESRSPEEKIAEMAVELSSGGASAEDIDKLNAAFRAGKEGRSDEYGRIAAETAQTGNAELVQKINEAFKAGEEARPAGRARAAEAGEARESLSQAIWKRLGGFIKFIAGLKKERPEATLERIQKRVAPAVGNAVLGELERTRGEITPDFLDEKLENLVISIAEKEIPEVQELKNTNQEMFSHLIQDLRSAWKKEGDEQEKALREIHTKYALGAEVAQTVSTIAVEIGKLRQAIAGKTLTVEERERAKRELGAMEGKSKELMKGVGWGAGLFLSLILLALLIAAILMISTTKAIVDKSPKKKIF